MATEFYIQPQFVSEALRHREVLRAKVEQWLGERNISIPPILKKGPHALIARQVPTFRYEDATFVLVAERMGIPPLWLAYTGDRMSTASGYKSSLARMKVAARVGRRGHVQWEHISLVSPQAAENKKLAELVCDQPGFEGRRLVDVHRELLEGFIHQPAIYDVTQDYEALSGMLRPEKYYPVLLSLAVAHGVLLEDFHGGESEKRGLSAFTARVFEPAFHCIERTFGVKPLIVQMPWWEELHCFPAKGLHAVLHWRTHCFALHDWANRIEDGA